MASAARRRELRAIREQPIIGYVGAQFTLATIAPRNIIYLYGDEPDWTTADVIGFTLPAEPEEIDQ